MKREKIKQRDRGEGGVREKRGRIGRKKGKSRRRSE